MRKIVMLATAVVLIAALVTAGAGCAEGGKKVTVGNKNFTEEYIVGHLMRLLLEDNGFTVDQASDLSSMALREGMEAGDIDICADYTGTSWMVHLGHEYEPGTSHQELYEKVKEEEKGNGFIYVDAIWNNNTYAFASWPEFVEENNLTTMSDLASYINDQNGEVKVFVDFEFSTRPDGMPALQDHYGFEVDEDYLMTGSPGASVLGLENRECEVAMVFGTDAAIAEQGWHVYSDDKSFFPPYDLCPYVREEVMNEYPEIEGILNELVATFPGGGQEATTEIVSECQGAWQELNAKVDIEKMEPDEAAREYLENNGLL